SLFLLQGLALPHISLQISTPLFWADISVLRDWDYCLADLPTKFPRSIEFVRWQDCQIPLLPIVRCLMVKLLSMWMQVYRTIVYKVVHMSLEICTQGI